jgi:hypothetical protein
MTRVLGIILVGLAFMFGIGFSAMPADGLSTEYVNVAIRFGRFFEATIVVLGIIALIKYIVRD